MMNGGKMDAIGQMVELIKAQGVPAGVGGHSLNMPMACEKHNVNRRFLREDLSHGPLLVGHAQGRAEGIRLDEDGFVGPRRERRQHVVQQSRGNDRLHGNGRKPWVAFKVMAAGAIPPRMAFSYAYRHGADFIIAGMFDFQVESDVKIAIENVQKAHGRKRPWRG